MPLQDQPLQLLIALVESPGDIVTRDELRRRLWDDRPFLDHDAALNTAMRKVREALGDSPTDPRYVETVARHGYRFLAPVSADAPPALRLAPFEASAAPTRGAPPAADLLPVLEPIEAAPAPVSPHRRASRLALALGVVVALLALAAGTWWLVHRPHPVEDTGLPALTSLTASRGYNAQPALSPDGASVAFVSDRTGPLEIYFMARAPGSRAIPITADGGQNVQPAWSPDGQWIAFHSKRRGGIWLVPATGGTPRRVAPLGSFPTWSPDSRRIAFSSGEGGFALQETLLVVDQDGQHERALTHIGAPPGGHTQPQWSHDGHSIAFVAFVARARFWELWVLDVASGHTRRVASGLWLGSPRFSPDDDDLYYCGVDDHGNSRLFRLSLRDPSAPLRQVLSVDPSHLESFVVGADGTVALGISSLDANLWQIRRAPDGSAGAAERLTDEVGRASLPAFSRDGSRLAFAVWGIGTEAQIWSMAPDGSRRELLFADGQGYDPDWSPDGRRLLINAVGETYWLDVGSRARSPALRLPLGAEKVRVSPDGKRLVFHVVAGDGRVQVWTANADGTSARQLTHDGDTVSFPAWSPDGRWLAVEVKRGEYVQIAVLPSSGGPLQLLTVDRGQSWPHSWAPDSDRVVFAGERDGRWNVFTVSRTTRQQVQLTHFDSGNDYVRYPADSPADDRIVFERGFTSGNVWTTRLR